MLWTLRAPDSEDLNFIRNSWLKSYRDNPAVSTVPNTTYYRRFHAIIDNLIADPNTRCIVACDPGMPGQIFGYAVGELDGADLDIHWIYTKHTFRNFGLMRAMEAELKKLPHTKVCYSTRTKITDKLNSSRQYEYDPFLLWSK